jgi:hypothetical protein
MGSERALGRLAVVPCSRPPTCHVRTTSQIQTWFEIVLGCVGEFSSGMYHPYDGYAESGWRSAKVSNVPAREPRLIAYPQFYRPYRPREPCLALS